MTYTPNYERITTALGFTIEDGMVCDKEGNWIVPLTHEAAVADAYSFECDDVLYAKGYETHLLRLHDDDTAEWLYFFTKATSDPMILHHPIFEAFAPTRELAILNVFERFLEQEGK